MKDEEKKALIHYLIEHKDNLAEFFNKTNEEIEDFISSLEDELITRE